MLFAKAVQLSFSPELSFQAENWSTVSSRQPKRRLFCNSGDYLRKILVPRLKTFDKPLSPAVQSLTLQRRITNVWQITCVLIETRREDHLAKTIVYVVPLSLLHLKKKSKRQDLLSLCCPVRLLYFFFCGCVVFAVAFPSAGFDLLRPPEDVVASVKSSSSVSLSEDVEYSLVESWIVSEPFVWRVINPFPAARHYFSNALESHECARCLLFDVRQYYCHFSVFIGSSLYQRAKPPQGTVLFINLLGKGLTPRACMGDGGSIWWAPAFTGSKLFMVIILLLPFYVGFSLFHPKVLRVILVFFFDKQTNVDVGWPDSLML